MAGSETDMHSEIERILIERTRIAERIGELAREIQQGFEDHARGTEIVLVPVLTGAIIFLADLVRQLPQKMRINVLSASSYPGKTRTSSGVLSVEEIADDLTGRHVLIVDDILDSGSTIMAIRGMVEDRGAASVQACVLLRKQRSSALDTRCEYVGFDIPDEFVVGYGLDYDGYYRNLPDIAILKREDC